MSSPGGDIDVLENEVQTISHEPTSYNDSNVYLRTVKRESDIPTEELADACGSEEMRYLKSKLLECSESLAARGRFMYCSMDGLETSTCDDETQTRGSTMISSNSIGDAVANTNVVQKFGEDFYPESVIPTQYTWFQEDGLVCRYVYDFVIYNSRGERFTPLDYIGRFGSDLIMFAKVRHVGVVHTIFDLIETSHPIMEQYQAKRKTYLEQSDEFLKVPRKQRLFPIRINIVDWFMDVGGKETDIPYLWAISENDVYYRLDRASGRYLNAFTSSRILFDITSRLVKTMQTEEDASFKDAVSLIFSGSDKLATAKPTTSDDKVTTDKDVNGTEFEKNTWGASVHVEGSELADLDRNLDIIFTECRWYDAFFRTEKGGLFMNELLQRLKDQLPFHYFDKKLMTMDYRTKNSLAKEFESHFKVEPLPEIKQKPAPKVGSRTPRQPKSRKQAQFDIDEYNSQHSRTEIKSKVSGRIIRCGKLLAESTIPAPQPRKQQPQTDVQKTEEYRRAVEIEAKCDGFLLPLDFDCSGYNTSSEPSDDGSTTTTLVLANDVDVPLTSTRYYPRDLPLRSLKFYSTDDIIELCDLSRQFSASPYDSLPLLPKLSLELLESSLIYTSSLDPYAPPEPSSFEFTRPLCICSNPRYELILNDKPVNKSDQNYEDGLQWLYHLNDDLVDENDLEYIEDLENGVVDKFLVLLLKSLGNVVHKSGFEAFIQELRNSDELTDKKKELQERDLQIAITDAELVKDFINNHGGCMYRGRFKKFTNDPEFVLPYINSLRWNKRFKKLLRVVSVSANYRFSTISHFQTMDTFTVSVSVRPGNCPLEILYPNDDSFSFKTIYPENVFEVLPTFKKTVNVWRRENKILKHVEQNCLESLNNRLAKEGLNAFFADKVQFQDEYVPVLGFGYRESESPYQADWILNPDMLTDYTWPFLLRSYLFYALYSCKYNFCYKLNSSVWGDPSASELKFTKTDDETRENGLEDSLRNDDENINSSVLNNSDDEDEADDVEDGDEGDDEEEEKTERSTRRGWGINRYCPYYDFSLEWYPDSERMKRIFQGRVSEESVKTIFNKLRSLSYYELDVRERLSLLVWLGEILAYGPTGRAFIDSRNEDFFQLRSQISKNETFASTENSGSDLKKPVKRQRGIGREIAELEERYLQKGTFLGWDRFYNSYYYLGSDFGPRIFVQTLPNTKFNQTRCAQRAKTLRLPSFGSEQFSFDLNEFALKFSQDRLFPTEARPKRGRVKKVKTETQEETEVQPAVDLPSIATEVAADATEGVKTSEEKVQGNLVQTVIKRKRVTKRRTKMLKPRLRRSREVFDRQPTSFNSVSEYFHYLRTIPPRLTWCVIDDIKQLKRFIPRMSQFTTNERNLQVKLQYVESEFSRVKYEQYIYKAPSPHGELLLSLTRGVYRYYKNFFSKITLSHFQSFESNLSEGYSSGLKINSFVNSTIKKITKLLCGDTHKCKSALMLLLEILLLFDHTMKVFLNHEYWNIHRIEWKKEIELVYGSLASYKGKEDGSACLCSAKPNDDVIHNMTLNRDTIILGKLLYRAAEKVGLLFRYFEVFSGDLSIPIKYLLPMNTINFDGVVSEHKIFNFISDANYGKTLVYFPAGALEAHNKLKDFLSNYTKFENTQDILYLTDRMKSFIDLAPAETLEVKIKFMKIFKVTQTISPSQVAVDDSKMDTNVDDKTNENIDENASNDPSESTGENNTEIPENNENVEQTPNPNGTDVSTSEGMDKTKEMEPEPVQNIENAEYDQIDYWFIEVICESIPYDAEDDTECTSQEELDEGDGTLIPNLRKICRNLSRLEKTRATRKTTEEAVFVPRGSGASPSKTFAILVPILNIVKTSIVIDPKIEEFLVPHTLVNKSLQHIWRQPMRCKQQATQQNGTIRRANYASADIWRCLAIEWHDNRKEQQLHNLWDITS
ncbi:hypothetical protein BEWA_034570 [Theileria equi strain WA]|uniref:Uncharacterized protein n=1 Tax=Theileria equi strain WA TaxID=1537102 RepID=L0B0D6_THEEQ|nr:hypothetical protein BEWA_034570 [Theileria equi strain WA]AFZ80599.1 hypothetical protein BEWA_034570 [Theileria equi strain WA]|eukprot:XP_004830265.1 hypothetical protein BEWA_034570 [Theileria equi strain WA]